MKMLGLSHQPITIDPDDLGQNLGLHHHDLDQDQDLPQMIHAVVLEVIVIDKQRNDVGSYPLLQIHPWKVFI